MTVEVPPETVDTTTDSDRLAEHLEEAADLIGISKVWSGQLLHTAVELGIFELLTHDPLSASAVADELDLDDDACYRVLRTLGHFGVLEENDRRQFALTPVGELFQADHPHSVRDDLLLVRSPEHVSAMLHLPDIVREGEPDGFTREHGCGVFEYIEDHPGFAEVFNAFMSSASRRQTGPVLDALGAYDFSQFARVCDVGGGHGHLLCHLLEAKPHLDGTVLDLPSVVAETARHWDSKLGVAERCTYVAGDMFETVPEADAFFLKWILHDWDDEACVQILSNVREAAPADGRVFVVEAVVPGPETSHFSKQLDMTMLVVMGGRERTEAEYAELFERAGWELVERWDAAVGPMSVLEANVA